MKSSSSSFYDTLDTPLGTLHLIFAERILVGISLNNKPPEGIHWGKNETSTRAKTELTEYFNRERTEFTLRTSFVEGTDFEQSVWKALIEVPYGETRTYKWLAERIGRPQAFRAVGRALGKNPIPIIVPCHRIIETDGSLGGYSSGIEIKLRLLEIEYYTKLSRLKTT
jgi:methylated-DNA-[protein]-cysteine S-methyltransferase